MVIAAIVLLGPPDLRAYASWRRATLRPANMNAATAPLCIGPPSWDRSADNPHFPKRFHVYVNGRGEAAMARGTRFPAGSVIVKAKYDAATLDAHEPKLPAEPELLTIMVKERRGSKPATGDWSYYAADAALRRVDGSREARCAACHAAQAKRDFTFRDYGYGNGPRR